MKRLSHIAVLTAIRSGSPSDVLRLMAREPEALGSSVVEALRDEATSSSNPFARERRLQQATYIARIHAALDFLATIGTPSALVDAAWRDSLFINSLFYCVAGARLRRANDDGDAALCTSLRHALELRAGL